ncbi:MAG: hypothetical protein NC489_14690 [Ruminococcus flavefaciens]|nr:hypothetical protein [Ruminococcus flavefaciens]
MTAEDTKRWLNRAYTIEKRLQELETLVNRNREHAEGLSMSGQYNNIGKSSTRLNRAENAFMKLADIEHRYDSQVQELEKATQEISNAIAELNDDELEVVLIHRYLLFDTAEQTAELMNYSVSTIKRRTKKAIEKMCDILCSYV